MRSACLLFVVLGWCAAGGSGTAHAQSGQRGSSNGTDPFPHRSEYATVNGIKLNYLDWGGSGPPVVMIHGIADDPHVFDDLAARMHDRFRIVAYARRGHGQSDSPSGPYDAAALVEDLRQLMDHLKIARASLVGWSLGGNEISDFAGRYPDRVAKLVYLESGYDWSEANFAKAFTNMLGVTSPTPADLKSLDTLRTWFRRSWLGTKTPWSPGLEAYLRDFARVKADGTVSVVPTDPVIAAILATVHVWPRDYTRIKAPALVLYTEPFFPSDHPDAAMARQLRDFERDVMVPFRRANMDRIRRELKGARIEEIPGRTHMSIGVEQPDALAKLIGEFLRAGEPRSGIY
jgi:pimeloyl-ACP methyl ester carboxylesterase